MKSLRPATILALGSVLMGIVFAVVMVIGQAAPLTPRGVGIALGCGSLIGLVTVAPIAAGEAFGRRLARLLGRHAFGLHWHVSFFMAIAMGFLLASMLRRAFDALTALAAAVLFVGAWIKTLLGVVYGQGEGRGAGRDPSGGAPNCSEQAGGQAQMSGGQHCSAGSRS